MNQGNLLIGGTWSAGSGPDFTSLNPATGEEIWRGPEANADDVHRAVLAARDAFEGWAALSFEQRDQIIEAFGGLLAERRAALAETIARDTGKPLWESDAEVGAMIGKIAISRDAYAARTSTTAADIAGGQSLLSHRPHGVMAVFGPFNFPGHLPNGHIVPALMAGNTIVFKPSELTPLAGEFMVQCWHDAGLPGGVMNLVQGARETGIALARHEGLNGLLFTGSSTTGRILHQEFGGHPEKILALEMGGNNPLIAWDADDAEAAALIIAQSAYVTAGQRCTCARRLVVPSGPAGERLIAALQDLIPRLTIGRSDDDETPFMGPVISNDTADMLLCAQEKLIAGGGHAIVEMTRMEDGLPFLTPGLIDVTAMPNRDDEEYFGPLLQIIRVADFDAAITEANDTAYGLAAGLISENKDLRQRFLGRIRAGIVNWNRPTTGASSAAPFGGVGLSGNHRPGAYYAADYCAYPMASMIADKAAMPGTLPAGIRPCPSGK
ncbi:MAG: succinylglutamate-semialdehyde dehydrogenase [Sphingomonadales bacterium]